MKIIVDPHEVGRWLRDARRSGGLTQAEFAAQLHVSQSTLSRMESGLVRARIYIAEHIAGDVVAITTNDPIVLREARSYPQ